MSESVTLTRDELNALIDERVAGVARRSGFDPFGDMPEQVNAIRRTHPDSPAQQMEQVAEQRGGLWSAKNPAWRKYGGIRKKRDGSLQVVEACPHATPKQCDQCWTPETEARWAFALGLTEDIPLGLDEPEAPRSQRANVPTTGAERVRLGNRLPANSPG